LVWHRDEVGDNFTEHYFKGPLHKQLRDALSFIKTNIIHEHVIKVPNQAEALRFYNFPYEAVEEALSNAVYHKGYDLGKPIEVQIWPDKITVLSYPGPVPPVDSQILQHKKIEARDYRNRRIGDFLKELDLTEGRGSGFPKMYKKMANNGSPEPIIYTDEQSILFLATLPIHPLTPIQESNQVNDIFFNNLDEIIQYSNGLSVQQDDQVSVQQIKKVKQLLKDDVSPLAENVLRLLKEIPLSRKQILENLNLTNHTKNNERHIAPLIAIGWIVYTIPDNPKDRNQKYTLTKSDKRLLELIN
jgi:ATP-dependent DNA helicase RecG